MNKEIELKARVGEPEQLKMKLHEYYGESADFFKRDVYYRYPSGQLVRLRDEGCGPLVTLKRKTVSRGIEVNDELEFGVSDGEKFLSYCILTGAEEYLRKTKRGCRFSGGDRISIELCEVEPLGWFIEIEKVVEASGEGSIPDSEILSAKNDILDILKKLGIGESALEPRFYSAMLLDRRS